MTAAALTPRVRILVVCDEVIPSETEDEVYSLEGVRQRVVARTFPCLRDISVFLLVSCPRTGSYFGSIRVVSRDSTRAVRWVPFSVSIRDPNEVLPFVAEVKNCRFLIPGEHTIEIWFTAPNGDAAQKAELPFYALEETE